MKIYYHDAGHMTKMAATPIYGNKLASFKKGIQYVGWQNIENLGLQRSGHLEIRGIFLSISHFGAVIDYHFSAELKKTCLHKL